MAAARAISSPCFSRCILSITTVRPNGDLFVKIDDREELVAGSQAKRTGCSGTSTEPTHLIGAIQTGPTPHEGMGGMGSNGEPDEIGVPQGKLP